ncbi:MAG: phosphatidylglycerophosphatase A [Myxococcales bacterium]|nr:phosphatidylglycerophosphatase A [Myxococcales bacterium]USN51305.1 MAG: phosphatidylglycerophosphatase A [Myxococcales bacterium]
MSSNIKTKIALLIAEFFYCGRFPIAPGTCGTAGALVIWVPALFFSWSCWLILSLLLMLFFIGIWASDYGIEHYKKDDPKQVVIDEVVGVGIPFLIIDPSVQQVFTAFVLFRFFDILKPWPIKWVERSFPKAWGIMLDDVVAGIFALLALLFARYFFVFLY